ncbi:MAG: N-acetylmuramoyl-L-alanine amidase [Candidatus Gracilibacteria bacterium]|nr:N-acetylmuramoyl-L-alanine amidase [Candidatus Gracilibacteria bacterium]
MSKIFKGLLVIFFTIIVPLTIFGDVFASNSVNIITRSEWGADESYRYKDSSSWKDYFDNLATGNVTEETDAEKKAREKTSSINNYLSTKYKEENTLLETITKENGHELVWPIQKSNYVKSIIVHHTDTSSNSSLDAIRSIYQYHALTKGWGDIGYNYLIGYDGEIFEGRSGGDYVVGAHTLRNNRSSVGIAVIGKYSDDEITDKQYESLKKLVTYLSEKYGIDTTKQATYHRDCNSKTCSFYIEDLKNDAIVGHRDAGLTSCPGNKLYTQLQKLKKEVGKLTSGFTYIKNKSLTVATTKDDGLSAKLDKLSEHNLLTLLAAIDYKIDKTSNTTNLKKLRTIVYLKIQKLQKSSSTQLATKNSFDKTNYISIKLSYPDDNKITITKGKNKYDIKVSSGKLLVNNKVTLDIVNIKSLNGSYLEISSWIRTPEWDTEKKHNDNKFKGELILSVKNGKLLVVNNVLLSDYLKGLGEVSDGDNEEKIKTIIIAARTYARWYMTKAIKFPGESYEGSDNPDEFQRYLGYSLELRSPKIAKIVDETENQVITYNGDIVKPWYFSQSDGKTISYKDYCKQNSANCKIINYPYLTSVFDPGSVGKTKLGHGVGISGAGATYLASKGWTEEMIVKYYLKGVNVKAM